MACPWNQVVVHTCEGDDQAPDMLYISARYATSLNYSLLSRIIYHCATYDMLKQKCNLLIALRTNLQIYHVYIQQCLL